MSKTDSTSKSLGRRGEDLVTEYIKSKGLQILQRNFRTRDGEIDIIALDSQGDAINICENAYNLTPVKDCIVFIEVKTRRSWAKGAAIESIDEKKCRQIRKMAEIYLYGENKMNCDIRFDVITLQKTEEGRWKIIWIKRAF